MSDVDEMTAEVADKWGTALKENHSRDEVLNDQSLRDFYETVMEDVTELLADKFFSFGSDGINIKIDGRLRRASANVLVYQKFIKYNPKVFDYDMGDIVGLIAHELAHIATDASDGDWKFERFCNEKGIPLHAPDIGVDEYWEIKCPNHGVIERKTRESKVVKQAREGHRVCGACREKLTVEHVEK